ncbi:MAG: ATP-dependent acyl-CoA ligase [Gammaproteobacteria bacterium]
MARDLHHVPGWVVGSVLRQQAEALGEKRLFQIIDGESRSYAECDREASRMANYLASLGVGVGDRVAVFLPNGLAFCQAWLGIARAGAVMVAINTEYRGAFLRHALANCRTRVVVCDAGYLERIAEIEADLPDLQTVVVAGGETPSPFRRLRTRPLDEFLASPDSDPGIEVTYRDDACIMYTSGTTGPSKGVLMPHAHLYLFGLGTIEHMGLSREDIFYIVLPLFHANGLFMQLYATMIAGASAVIRRRFSAGEWLNDVRRHGATITNMLGAVSAFVLNQPPTDHDRDHRLRAVGVAPNSPDLDAAFRERFGVGEVFGLYGMTEVNIPLYTEAGVRRPGSCGKTWERYYELRIVDPETDEELPRNEVGEIVVRPRQPFGFMSGYDGMPEKTIEAWRNFWFHTGDAARMDEEGYVYFVDRIKDCIRRRGENISSYEVENVVAAHPDVADVAAAGIASEIEGAEEEVMVWVVAQPGRRIDPRALIEFCTPRMPRFALPRFVEVTDSLPKTPTGKVQKHLLRKRGVTGSTWDRERDTVPDAGRRP